MSQTIKESHLKYKVCVICHVPQSEAPGVLYAKFPQNINRFTCHLYDAQTEHICVNEVRKDLFASKNKLVPSLPPISAALYKHALRAAYQAGHIWGNALKTEVSIPCPSSWGWTKAKESWTLEWSAVTAIWSQLSLLDHCGCQSGCNSMRCGCRRVSLPCTAHCKSCKGGCTNQKCRKWIRLIGDVKLLQLSLRKIQYRFVCGNHFMPHYFTKSGKHLTKDAVPTVFPHHIKPLKKDVVKLFPMLMNRTNDKVLLKCTQRIVPIKREVESPDSTTYEYLEDEFQEHMDPEPSIIIKQEALDPMLKECLPKIIPILHHSLPPNSQTTEIYTINKDRQVIPITTKVLHDGKECIIELSQKKMPIVPREPKVIPVSNKVLSTILKKDIDMQIESLGYNNRDAYPRNIHKSPQNQLTKQKEEQMQTKIDKLQRRNKQLKRILKNICIVEEIESPNIKRVIEKAISNRQLRDGINEFTHEKQLAVAILKRALNAYHYLSCLMPLPNVCALQKIAKGVPGGSNTTKCRHLL